jgi:hypothetical protein
MFLILKRFTAGGPVIPGLGIAVAVHRISNGFPREEKMMKSGRTRTILVLMAFFLLAAAPGWSQQPYRSRPYEGRDGAFHLRLGIFQPEGDSAYWNNKERDFTGSIDDFENVSVGGDYLWSFTPRLGLLFSGSYFQGDSTNSYRGFEDNFGNRIRHDTTLQISSLTAGLHLQLAGAGSPVIPYVAAGGGIYFWRLEEDGDFITLSTLDIFNARLQSDGAAPGFYGLVGLEVPLGRTISIFGEGRWTQADDDLEGDFEDFGKIDLSGREFTAGLSWSF